MNRIADGMAWLENQMKEHCSTAVTYQRGDSSVTVNVVLGKTDYQIIDENGFETGAFTWDFIILATDLAFEPQVGDVIIHGAKHFEVMRIPGQDCWRWTGITRSAYRIHTKDIGDV